MTMFEYALARAAWQAARKVRAKTWVSDEEESKALYLFALVLNLRFGPDEESSRRRIIEAQQVLERRRSADVAAIDRRAARLSGRKNNQARELDRRVTKPANTAETNARRAL
jgi:hypothetical protein